MTSQHPLRSNSSNSEMQQARGRKWIGLVALLCALTIAASAKDVRLSIPKRTKPTPVQKLNQDGVRAVEKHDYKKAKTLFYKAYLIDPNDPFTLNNLGYVAELDGQVDRAARYYALAAAQTSDAVVFKSTEKEALGKPVSTVAGNAVDAQMQINHMNVAAIGLLQKDRAPEADLSLQKALKLDPNNPFTLNNLGYAKEKEGELEDAYRYYTQAASLHSDTPIVVTVRSSWRGKPISEIAAKNADSVKKLMEHEQDVSAQVARFNTRGVAAINRNDFKLARQYFEKSYELDPKNAFALNNMGYLAEMDGDRESADFYYGKAKEADQSSVRVAYATRKDVEGMKMAAVASDSEDAVVKATEEAAEARRRAGGPVTLLNRDNTPVVEPAVPPKIEPSQPIHSVEVPEPSGNEILQPLPDNQQPGAAPQSQPADQNPQGSGGLLMPLPDNQQPAPEGQPQPTPQGQPSQQPPPPQPANPEVSNPQGGLLMPLPDDQQPGAAQPQDQQPQTQQPQNQPPK